MKPTTYLPTPFSYSSAVVAGDYAFIALHRGFGTGFSVQFASLMRELQQTLQQIDLSLSSLVKINVWLKNVSDLPEMEQLMLDYFPSDRCPARMTATTDFIDTDCLVMIDGIAYCKEAEKEQTWAW